MKIKRTKFLRLLLKSKKSIKELSCALSTCNKEVVAACFSGASLNEEQSKQLVNAIGAENAYKIIDWKGSNAKRPRKSTIFECEYAN